MKLSVSSTSDASIIKVAGELDRDTLKHNLWTSIDGNLKKEILKNTKTNIDLSEVGRADTAGLAWVLNAVRDIRQQGVTVTVSKVPKKLMELAALSNADQLLVKNESSNDPR
ncbi:lipid asymmetry maintenance protein MlaB [Glaciecola siphonariae]|uniref:Lipid asymmetry maintenance protein MlaB n=1 Tax=Glaciecola siphonariae TaxID=521012 RepID=A0ABV9M1L5_9ALTE